MLNSIISINDSALEALDQHEVYRAQILFKENVNKSPCFLTLNNLGVFHVFEGLLKPDNSGRGATKLGISYLKKAECFQKSNLTLLAYGYACFRAKEYRYAYEDFRQACELMTDYSTVYNCGVSLYMSGSFHEATTWFDKALSICDIADYIETFTSRLFSLLYSNKEEFLSAFKRIFDINNENMEWEKFVFSYFANDLQLAESQIESMLKHFSIDLYEMAIVFDCLFKLGKGERAAEYLKQKVESLGQSNYNMQPQISRMNKAFSQADYRSKLITEYRHNIPLIKQCCYYGCKKHNPL